MEEQQEGLSLELKAMISFSLPVIVQHGEGSANITIQSVTPEQLSAAEGGGPAVRVAMSRSGLFGAYGRLVAYQQLSANSPVTEIGRAGNVAIYHEVNSINRLLPLNPGISLPVGSWLRVVFEGEGERRGEIFAEQTFQIGR